MLFLFWNPMNVAFLRSIHHKFYIVAFFTFMLMQSSSPFSVSSQRQKDLKNRAECTTEAQLCGVWSVTGARFKTRSTTGM